MSPLRYLTLLVTPGPCMDKTKKKVNFRWVSHINSKMSAEEAGNTPTPSIPDMTGIDICLADVAITPDQKDMLCTPYRAAIGVVLLNVDETSEDSMMKMRPDRVALHFTRIPYGGKITTEALISAGDNIAAGAKLIIPGAPLASICYACTSSSMLLGDDKVKELLNTGRPDAKPTTPTLALNRALRFLGVESVALGTPYLHEITASQAADLMRRGFKVPAARFLGMLGDYEVARLSGNTLKALARSVFEAAKAAQDSKAPDAVFLSCTQLHGPEISAELEEELGVPCISSNQVMMWDLLRLAGIDDPVLGFGSLMSKPDRSKWVE
jgi:maleate isomerase